MRHNECFAETLLTETLPSLLCRKPQRTWGLEWHHHLDNHTVEEKVSVPECTAEIKNEDTRSSESCFRNLKLTVLKAGPSPEVFILQNTEPHHLN